MSDDTGRADIVRIEDFGKRVVEELLFRGALAFEADAAGHSATPVPGAGSVTVTLQFTLRADADHDCIEIATPGAVEPMLVTRLQRPF